VKAAREVELALESIREPTGHRENLNFERGALVAVA
jgi:hypothetical protein